MSGGVLPARVSDPSGEGAVPAALADHVGAAARSHGVDAAAVCGLLAGLNDHVRSYPGVADLVFEYRRAFDHDPLVDRSGDAYYLLVPPHVLPAFADALGADGAAWDAARETHRRAFVAGTGVTDHGDWDPLVLVAESGGGGR